MGKDKEDQEKPPEGEATVLPAREAMSLITQESASGQENVTDEDRDEHFENSDSASSQT